MKIQSLGVTTKDKEGNVCMAMLQDDMPVDCVVIFILKEDYPKLIELLKEENVG